MTYNEIAIQMLASGKDVVAYICDESYERAIQDNYLSIIESYDPKSKLFINSRGTLWKFVVPVICSPIKLPLNNI